MSLNIAIVGTGFTGLAAAWHLLKYPNVSVTLLDQKEVGKGTSGIAAGLLHYYAGLHAKLNRFGREGYHETCELIKIAEKTLGRPVSESSGILRLALSEEQDRDYALAASQFQHEIHSFSSEKCRELVPYLNSSSGIFIPSALTVYTQDYLMGLWEACRLKGALFQSQKITHLDELSDYDSIILATGGESHQFVDFKECRLIPNKGHLIELEWPSHLPILPFPINSHIYLVMSETKKTCLVGSTYERNFTDLKVDVQKAKSEILPKAYELFPALQETPIVNIFVGLRLSSKNHLPFIKKLNHKTWLLTAMGSKGLLYHSYFSKQLVDNMMQTLV